MAKKKKEEGSIFNKLISTGADFIASEVKRELRNVFRKQVRNAIGTVYDAGKEKLYEKARERAGQNKLLQEQKENFHSNQLISGLKVSEVTFEDLQRKVMAESFKKLTEASNSPVTLTVQKQETSENKICLKITASAKLFGATETREEVLEMETSSYDEILNSSFLWIEFGKLKSTEVKVEL